MHIETTKRQIQFQSCRLARLRVPLLPMPIHSVWLQFSNCCSSALRLREITQLFSFHSPATVIQRKSAEKHRMGGASIRQPFPWTLTSAQSRLYMSYAVQKYAYKEWTILYIKERFACMSFCSFFITESVNYTFLACLQWRFNHLKLVFYVNYIFIV